MTDDDSDAIEDLTPTSLMTNEQAERRAFLQDFQAHITDLLRKFRREYPYRQTVRWRIDFEDGRNHTFHVVINPPRSTTNP